jgi:hypothetical protein
LKTNLSKTFLLLASLAFFNGANADTTCVQDTDSSGASGYFVNDGTKTYNGKNGTASARRLQDFILPCDESKWESLLMLGSPPASTWIFPETATP